MKREKTQSESGGGGDAKSLKLNLRRGQRGDLSFSPSHKITSEVLLTMPEKTFYNVGGGGGRRPGCGGLKLYSEGSTCERGQKAMKRNLGHAAKPQYSALRNLGGGEITMVKVRHRKHE